ncbi:MULTISPECIES: ABC transporter permease [Pseudomonas]|uniref:Transport permease protein n=1 Tax=Pseudomonas asplenii TaxID=53407 RepID=A0A0N0E3F1_9PSED|nr:MULTISPECIES: ABC transporter permease [Pseudomonas]KPA90025.1 ABC-type polysaccharide/polyol phosphate exporter [Pseudomonas fuscovaginae]KPA94795.1 permease component ABC-type polysaccharide/polyol phosphate exporter [Pseudomonas fuscovaginae]
MLKNPSRQHLVRNVIRHRSMIQALAVRDLQNRYAGTLGGMVWTFMHPLAVVVVFYFVFAVGFRAQGPVGTPFVLWFVCGLVPWFFFSEALQAITHSITRNDHLVKKTVFPTEVLPVVHLVSGLVPHGVFLLVLAGMMLFYDVTFLWQRLLFVYFLLCMSVLLLGLGWLLAALQVFYRDIGQALTILLNLWFWSTPIVWSLEIMPPAIREWAVYNPIYYIIQGYRGLLIFPTVSWPPMSQTLVFWGVSLSLFFLGSAIFRRLKPEFADVL